MSANPETFDRLRKHAYAWVAAHGRDRTSLHVALMEKMTLLRGEIGDDLTAGEAVAMIESITDWTLLNFTPGRRRPVGARRSRTDRAVEAGLLVMVADMLGRGARKGRHGAGSVRSLESLTGLSKSKISRILATDGQRRATKAANADDTPASWDRRAFSAVPAGPS